MLRLSRLRTSRVHDIRAIGLSARRKQSSARSLPDHIKAPPPSEVFAYTSGRWVYNEDKRLRERILHFDLVALAEAGVHATGRSLDDVAEVSKVAESHSCRHFAIAMRDGFSVIAKLNYAICQPSRYMLASEVATMSFLRSEGLPVPKVFGYNSDPGSPVGAGYLLAEKARGRSLKEFWNDMSRPKRLCIVDQLVSIEKQLHMLSFPAFGSIFFDTDLPAHIKRQTLYDYEHGTSKYCIGPDVSPWYCQNGQAELDLTGPSILPREILGRMIGERLDWLTTQAQLRYPCERTHRDVNGFRKADPIEHVASIRMVQKLLPFLVSPKQERPTLWHQGINSENIFISDDNRITAITGWRHASVLPTSLSAGCSDFGSQLIDCSSSRSETSQLSSHLEASSEEQRSQELELHDGRRAFRMQILEHALAPWEGNNITLKADLAWLIRNWSETMDGEGDDAALSRCPISMSDEEIDEALDQRGRQNEADEQTGMMREYVGVASDGWTTHEHFEKASARAQALKQNALNAAGSDAERRDL